LAICNTQQRRNAFEEVLFIQRHLRVHPDLSVVLVKKELGISGDWRDQKG